MTAKEKYKKIHEEKRIKCIRFYVVFSVLCGLMMICGSI